MIKAQFKSYGSYVTDSVYQWDLNQKLSISGLVMSSAPVIAYSSKAVKKAIIVQSKIVDGVIDCDIPNALLQFDNDITAHLCSLENKQYKAVEKMIIPVIKRAMPADYLFTDNVPILTYEAIEVDIQHYYNLSKSYTDSAKSEIDIERKRIDNLVKDTTDNVVEYKADNFLMSCKSDAQASTTETALNVFKNISSKSENLGNFITISSALKIQIKKSGLYSFDCKIQVTGVNASTGRQYARLKINDVQKNEYMISLVGETDEEFTNFIVSLNEGDTISFTGESDFDDTWITLYTTIHILDYDGKVKIPDITKEVSDIRVGKDGTVYGTAGEAVRKQIGNLTEDLDWESKMLKNELDDFIDKSNNLFNKESVSDGFYSGNTGKLSINSAYCCVMIPFTCKDTITITGTNYDQCYYDSNKTFIGSSTLKGKALTIDGSTVSGRNPQTGEKLNNNKIRYIGINIEKNEYDLNKYMICRGESLSNSYVEYGVKKIKKDVKIDYTQVDGTPSVTKVYTVGSDGDYTSFTDCLKNLKDVTDDEKIIYVKTGVYDIFEELGGSDYINSLDTSNLNWRDVQPIVPINTKIIGQGNVTLKFTPTAEEIKSKDIAFLFSPLNISYATEIDNIKIECTNCRYAIHFETNGLIEYADGKSRFKNLVCHKKSGRFGNPQVFGSGIGRRNQWEFDSCIFTSDMPNIWTTHTNTSKEDDSCNIIFNDCIFANDIESEATKKWELVQFISGGAKIGHKCKHNYVRMNNCYIGGKVGLSYQGTETGEKQQFDLTMLKCDTQGVSISEKFGENPYIPKIY